MTSFHYYVTIEWIPYNVNWEVGMTKTVNMNYGCALTFIFCTTNIFHNFLYVNFVLTFKIEWIKNNNNISKYKPRSTITTLHNLVYCVLCWLCWRHTERSALKRYFVWVFSNSRTKYLITMCEASHIYHPPANTLLKSNYFSPFLLLIRNKKIGRQRFVVFVYKKNNTKKWPLIAIDSNSKEKERWVSIC